MIENKEELKEFIKETVREILIEEQQIITERSVYKDNGRNYYIAVHPTEERNFFQDPYFKFSPYSDFRKCARISLKDAEYVVHYGFSLDMKDKTIEVLMKLLNSPSNIGVYKGIRVWDAILDDILDVCNIRNQSDIEAFKYQYSNIPNYKNIVFKEKDKNCKKERW